MAQGGARAGARPVFGAWALVAAIGGAAAIGCAAGGGVLDAADLGAQDGPLIIFDSSPGERPAPDRASFDSNPPDGPKLDFGGDLPQALDLGPPPGCTTDEECDDGIFCNGTEVCDPMRGCQPGTSPCDGQGGACGASCDEASRSCMSVSAVTNDSCDTALDISGGGTFSGDTSCGTVDEPMHSCGQNPDNGPDVYFKFTLQNPQVVYFDTFGSTFDTTISLRQGGCPGTELGCVDDACQTMQSQGLGILPAGSYSVRLSGFMGGKGSYQLTFRTSGCTQARLLPGQSPVSGNTCNSANALTPPDSCSQMPSQAPEDVYVFAGCPGETLSANLCPPGGGAAYDSILYLRADDCEGGEIVCNDDGACSPASSFTTTLGTAALYFLVVDGFDTACGAYQLDFSFQ